MLNNDEIEILELEPSYEEIQQKEKKKEIEEVPKKSKIVPFFLVCVLVLIVAQIIILTMITINSI